MIKNIFVKGLLLVLFLLLGNTLFNSTTWTLTPETKPLGHGNISALNQAYQHWQLNYQQQGGEQFLTLPLYPHDRFVSASEGQVKVDLLSGTVTASAKGLQAGSYHLWLVASQKSDASIIISKPLGALTSLGDQQFSLHGELNRTEMKKLNIKHFVISAASQDPVRQPLLTGSPSLFQKIFYYDQYWMAVQIELPNYPKYTPKEPFSLIDQILPKAAFAKPNKRPPNVFFTDQIAKGRDLFLNETFDGNGRTCSTCHRLDNNHTIDPKYITTLADDDPLFIAENNPQLADLEQPLLLRQFGLVLSNIDGFDKPGVLRSVPHLLALGTSITPEEEFEGKVVTHALGWSADGSSGDGSLRSFTLDAVRQHMPKTLNREEGVDFRLPTDDELDALEAYMLSLGRAEDLDLDNMYFSSPLVQRGRELFHSKEPGTGQCKGCHLNAGANSSSSLQNGNRNTGVDNMPDNLLKLVWEKTPADGGFGNNERSDCGESNKETCYGNHEFNMTTVVEAADTPPFFHNNSVNTIEEAVAFYNSNAFHASPGANPADPDDLNSVCGRCIHLEPTQVTAIALFLRTINAMENIRSSNNLDWQARSLKKRRQRKDLIKLAIAETEDAIEVLEGGAIIPNPQSVKLLHQALVFQQRALQSRNKIKVRKLITQSMKYKQQASDLLLREAPENDAID